MAATAVMMQRGALPHDFFASATSLDVIVDTPLCESHCGSRMYFGGITFTLTITITMSLTITITITITIKF